MLTTPLRTALFRTAGLALTLLVVLSPPSHGQVAARPLGPLVKSPDSPATLALVDGTVVDLTVDAEGALLYCTTERDVGRVTLWGQVTVLADAASGPFPADLHAVAMTPTGDVAVLDAVGDIHHLAGDSAPATLVYDDLYIILGEPTDLLIDAAGNHVVASRTPTPGIRSLAWISPDGNHWAYYLVKHAPLGLAFDAATGDLLMSDADAGGALRLVDVDDPGHGTSALDVATQPGFSVAAHDGDLVVDAAGDAWFLAQGGLYRHDRSSGVTTLVHTGLGDVRGLTLSRSSGQVPSASGFSLYVAKGSSPTRIVEFGDAPAASTVSPPDMGAVPGPGVLRHVMGPNVFELAVDNEGHLLAGGDKWDTNFRIVRVELPSFAETDVATMADGLTGRIEGICVAVDDTIFALGSNGAVHEIVEGAPPTVTTVFSDPLDQVVVGKDLVLDQDGSFFIADRAGWDVGQVERVDPLGVLTAFAPTFESRGLLADPFTGQVLVTEWNDSGFAGTVGRMDTTTGVITQLPGFIGMNYSNHHSWGDGDLVMDVEGGVYTVAEDEFALLRYDPATQSVARIGSGYKDHPTGVVIAQSSNPAPGETGWSVYVSEFRNLWEIADVPAPASALLQLNAPPVGNLVGSLPGNAGEARALLHDPARNRFLVSMSGGQLLAIDPTRSKIASRVAGPADGLDGDLVTLARGPLGLVLLANRDGHVWRFDQGVPTLLFDDPFDEVHHLRGLQTQKPRLNSPGGEVYLLSGPEFASTLNIHRMAGRRGIEDGGTIEDTWTLRSLYGTLAPRPPGFAYVAIDADGVVRQHDLRTGTEHALGGHYTRPVAVTVAPSTAGRAGTSAFVLDAFALYEIPLP